MWETTGKAEYLKDFEAKTVAPQTEGRRFGGSTSTGKIGENWDWGNVRNLGTFTYVLSRKDEKR
ncbi:MAG: hypothetical protein A2Y77_10975 [Planctomycetes bacterium RBG_13_62_9]|nr:MAG: hypothetical protein A2Y77_10975 [Planctomycetes bacterium RBG_13_62_9]